VEDSGFDGWAGEATFESLHAGLRVARLCCGVPYLRRAHGSSQLYKGTSANTLCREISIVSGCSGNARFATGASVVVKYAGTPGFVVSNWLHNGFLYLVCSIPGPSTALHTLRQASQRSWRIGQKRPVRSHDRKPGGLRAFGKPRPVPPSHRSSLDHELSAATVSGSLRSTSRN